MNYKHIINTLSTSLWVSDTEGVFYFDFQNIVPLTNTNYPYYYTLFRYTPGLNYDADYITIPGVITNNGDILYGGGRKGTLSGDSQINWDDGGKWYKQDKIPVNNTINYMNLDGIQNRARINTEKSGDYLDEYYY